MKGLPNIRTGCSGKWCSHQPWSYWADTQTEHSGSWFRGGRGSAGFMGSIVRVLPMFLTRRGEGENLANLFTGSPWVSGMGSMIQCLEQAGSIILAMLFMLLIRLDTELTQKVPFPCRKNKKKGGFGVHNQSISLTLFSVLGEGDSFTGTNVPPVEAFSANSFFLPHLCNSLGGHYCCIQCMNPITGRQTFTNPLCSPPPIPASRDQHMPVFGTGSTTVSAIWLHNFKSFSNQLNDGSYTGYTSWTCFSKFFLLHNSDFWNNHCKGVRQEGRGKSWHDPGQACTCKELHPWSSYCQRCNYHLEW